MPRAPSGIHHPARFVAVMTIRRPPRRSSGERTGRVGIRDTAGTVDRRVGQRVGHGPCTLEFGVMSGHSVMFRHRTGPLTLRRVADQSEPKPYHDISLTPVGATLGARVDAIDLASVTDEQCTELDRALLEHKVLFFRDQHITREEHAVFAARFGPLVDDQLVLQQSPNPVDNMVEFTRDAAVVGYENEWHTDGTFRPVPPLATILRAIDVPAVGGDTLFADMAAAFDNLDDDLRDSHRLPHRHPRLEHRRLRRQVRRPARGAPRCSCPRSSTPS